MGGGPHGADMGQGQAGPFAVSAPRLEKVGTGERLGARCRDARVETVIGISMFSQAATADAPEKLLMITGA